MPSVVFDASAILALLRNEPGAEIVSKYIGDGVISAVNLQEIIKALLIRGFPSDIIRTMIDALHLIVRPHRAEDAYTAAALCAATARYGSGLGDRTCMALAIREGCPALTTDQSWTQLDVPGLTILLARGS